MRIACLSYVPLGYGTPQIVYLLRSLAACYKPREAISVFEPDWSTHGPQHRSMRDFTFYRYDKNGRGPDEHYSAQRWIEARRPDLLVVTHFKFIRGLVASRHRPTFVLYYNFENPSDDERPTEEDYGNLRRGVQLIDFTIYTEQNRRRLMQEAGYLNNVPSLVLFNVPPKQMRPIIPAHLRNGRLLYQGTIDFKRTYIDFLCRTGRPPLPCDIFGAIPNGNLAECIRRRKVQREHHLRYLGMVPADALTEARREYSYSLVMWKPITENYFYACPNKFFEAIASGIPPIAAPHPQCAEILKKYGCGILLENWSFTSFCAGLNRAMELQNTHEYTDMVERCVVAHERELNWEAQFSLLRPFLPPPSEKEEPATRRKKLVLVDPSLVDEVGHNYIYCTAVLEAALLEDIEAIVASNRMLVAPLDPRVVTHSIFCSDFWGRMVQVNGYSPGSDAPFSFLDSLRELFAREDLITADHIFVPNISDDDLGSLAGALENVEALRIPCWHIFIRHEIPRPSPRLRFNRAPYFVRRAESFLRNMLIRVLWRHRPRVASLRRIIRAFEPGRVKFYTDTKELARHHRWTSPQSFIILPIPAVVRASDYRLVDKGKRADDGLVIVYSGDARQEKGFHLLPSIIRKCGDLMRKGTIRFRIQTHHTQGDPVILNSCVELRDLAKEFPIELIEKGLSNKEYLSLVQSADVLLAIYGAEYYRYRSSHVFIEGVSNGKPVVVSRGTSMARMLPRDCGWICREPSAADEVIRYLASDWYNAKELADRIGQQFREFHNSQRLVRILFGLQAPYAERDVEADTPTVAKEDLPSA